MLRISGIVLALWLAHAAVVFLMWRVRRARPAVWACNDALTTHRAAARRRRTNGVISVALLMSAAALAGKGGAAPQPVVMNDYADMLRRQGRFDEAEALARRAVEESGGKSVLFKLTLAQILRDAGKNPGELNPLLARYKRFDK